MIHKYRIYRAVCPRCHKEAVVKVFVDEKRTGIHEASSVFCEHFAGVDGQVLRFETIVRVGADITHIEEEI
jgi:putative methionine-R-sulfoxide reductase with GAF domain